ncbi:hypothetical protein OESDEN_08623 [Oesophagostomum dentatum]|uniref:Uncharacterized protein n=1 Tax=Oesophagostomum dentatum TaxID=61180 RepID=A0A0B1T1T0_OESDE|nr:hypothetical protein OESDEN_08623 [Oesophagostomum dentatum]
MNLYTVAGGLFGTHVTWDDIEEDMQRELDTVATFGPNKTAKNVGDGRGFMSRIALIEPDWQHKDKELPERFIVKIVSQLAILQLTDDISKSTNTENNFDSAVMKEMMEVQQKRLHNAEVTVYSHISKLPKGKVPSTKIYYTKKFSECNPVKGYLIMEYFENLRPVHIFENVPVQSLKKVLRAKAVLEAMSLKFTPEEKSEFPGNMLSELFGEMFKEHLAKDMFNMLQTSASEDIKDKVDKLEEVYPELMDLVWADNLSEELGR